MPPFFEVGERVIIEFGIGRALGEIVVLSRRGEKMTVRLSEGIMGKGDMPLRRRNDDDYDLLAGGKVKVLKLA